MRESDADDGRAPAASVDVAIVGGGPAGSATALSLRAHAPSLSILLIEASAYTAPRIGETLPPLGRRLLDHLGVWDAFQREPHQPVYATAAAWGRPEPREESFLFTPGGRGWHLDRRAFDAWLVAEAEARAVHVWRASCLRRMARDEGWRLVVTREGDEAGVSAQATRVVRARFLVDATGMHAVVARRCGARHVVRDRLTAFVQMFVRRGAMPGAPADAVRPADPRTLVEACEDGWWYSAALPGGARVAACFTDPAIGRRRRLHEPARFLGELAAMRCVSRAVGGGDYVASGPVLTRAVGSRCLDRTAGDDWIAVGDAASTVDPLSSQGILRALRSGVFASYAIGDRLARRQDDGLRRYQRFVREDFDAYLETRARYYAEERRWPASLFWRGSTTVS